MSTSFKFNLLVDGQKVRSLEELRKNFNLDDVLEYFFSGKLQKWLSSRDYKHELDQVKDIASSNKLDVSCKLLDIFKIEYDKDDLKYFIDETNQYKALDQETAAGNNSEQAQKNSSNIFPIRTSKLAFDCSDNESSGSYGAYQRLRNCKEITSTNFALFTIFEAKDSSVN